MRKLPPASLRETIQHIKSILEEIEASQYMYSIIENKIEARKYFREKFPLLLEYLRHSICAAYIINLYKLFEKDPDCVTLTKLINCVRYLKTDNLTVNKGIHKRFIDKADLYESYVRKIEEKLGKIRHQFYAHSTKVYRVKGNFRNLDIWFNIAKNIFSHAVDSIDYSNLNDKIKDKQQNLKQEIDLLLRAVSK